MMYTTWINSPPPSKNSLKRLGWSLAFALAVFLPDSDAWAQRRDQERPIRPERRPEGALPVLGTTTDQFGSPPTDIPFDFDNNQGEWVNYETPIEKGVVIFQGSSGDPAHDGPFVMALNEPNNRVEIMTPDLTVVDSVPVGQGLSAIAQRPGSNEVWVTMHHSAGVAVLEKNTELGFWEVARLIRPAISSSALGMGHSTNPAAIAFNTTGSKAVVSSSSTDGYWVIDATTYAATAHDGDFDYLGMPTRAKEPRDVIYDPMTDKFFMTIRRSSNNTSAIQQTDLGAIFIGTLIRLPAFGLSLPEIDVQCIDGTTDLIDTANAKTFVGTTIFNAALNPTNGDMVVTSTDSKNDEFVGELSFPDGEVVRNQLTIIAQGETAPPYKLSLDMNTLSEAFGTPTAIAFSSQGWIYVATYITHKIAVFNADGIFQGSISTQKNPRGLAITTVGPQERLFVLSRGENGVEHFDITGGALPGSGTFQAFPFDPTYDRVKAGRKEFNDGSLAKKGNISCASCHQDLQTDSQNWGLAKFYDTGTFSPISSNPVFPKDDKLFMSTQDLRNLKGVPPYHWRGEQKDLEDFKGVFPNLFHGVEITEMNFALVKEYVFSGVYPTNPDQMLNRDFTPSARAGVTSFIEDPYNAAENTCVSCHTFPTGTDCSITDGFFHLNTALPNVAAVKTTQLRGLTFKRGARTKVGEIEGAEFHSPYHGGGSGHANFNFDDRDFVFANFGGLSELVRENISQFLFEYDNGTSPAANYSEMLNSMTALQSTLATFLVPQARAGHCDIAIRGRIRPTVGAPWVSVGFYYDVAASRFVSDHQTATPAIPNLFPQQLINIASVDRFHGVVLGVPVSSGRRVGVDTDRDGLFDADEIAAGLDPLDPDVDNDGFWDGEDSHPTASGSTNDNPARIRTINVEWVTSNSAKITYATTKLSPTRIAYGKTTSLGSQDGDPLDLPAGSNEWKKRHTVFVRLTDDSTKYFFSIIARNQHGVISRSRQQTFTTDGDLFTPMMRVTQLDAVGQGIGAGTTVDVTVKVVDNSENPLSNIAVRLVATQLLPQVTGPPVPLAQADVDTALKTNASGILNFTWTPPASFVLNAGDIIELSLQMARRQDTMPVTFEATVEDCTPEGPFFSFPESTAYCSQIVVQ